MKLTAIKIKPNGMISQSSSVVEKETSKLYILKEALPEADYRKRIPKDDVGRVIGNRVVCGEDMTPRKELFQKFEMDLNDKLEDLAYIKNRFNNQKQHIK